MNTSTSSPNPSTAEHCPAAAQPYVKPSIDQLRQVWPLAPTKRQRLIDYYISLTQPGATIKVKTKRGTIERPVTAREVFKATKLLVALGESAIQQQKRDIEAEGQAADQAAGLNDFVTDLTDAAGQRMTEIAQEQGLRSGGELSDEQAQQIYDEVEKEHSNTHKTSPGKDRAPVVECPPEQRGDWLVPLESQQRIMDRLFDMADPSGKEYENLKSYEQLMAGRVLTMFVKLANKQTKLDQRRQAQAGSFSWSQADERMGRDERRRIAERDQEREEFRIRKERRQQAGDEPQHNGGAP